MFFPGTKERRQDQKNLCSIRHCVLSVQKRYHTVILSPCKHRTKLTVIQFNLNIWIYLYKSDAPYSKTTLNFAMAVFISCPVSDILHGGAANARASSIFVRTRTPPISHHHSHLSHIFAFFSTQFSSPYALPPA